MNNNKKMPTASHRSYKLLSNNSTGRRISNRSVQTSSSYSNFPINFEAQLHSLEIYLPGTCANAIRDQSPCSKSPVPRHFSHYLAVDSVSISRQFSCTPLTTDRACQYESFRARTRAHRDCANYRSGPYYATSPFENRTNSVV